MSEDSGDKRFKKAERQGQQEDSWIKEMVTIRGPMFEISLGSSKLSMNELVELSYKIGHSFFGSNLDKHQSDARSYVG